MPAPGTRHWIPDPQQYAVEQERGRHDQAMFHFGEYAMFVLLWRIEDYEAGRVGRCPTCFISRGKVAEVYQQPAKKECPDCFGTTFEGGWRAKVVRPSLWDQSKPSDEQSSRGEVDRSTAGVQSTSDFYLRTHDYIIKADGTRWLVQTASENGLTTGFAVSRDNDALGYNFGTCTLIDPSHVAYTIPPLDPRFLNVANVRFPRDWSSVEEIRGPLV